MREFKPAATPVITGKKLKLDEGAAYRDPHEYRSIMGALQYLTFTRPNIVYTINQVSQFMHDP